MASEDVPRVLKTDLPSSLTAYHDFMQKVLQQLKQLGWQECDLFGVHLALEESISNAIRHGNKEDPCKKVHVTCEVSSGRFLARICDEGEGYKPEDVPDCCRDENLQRAGGRGLALIHAYMTNVEHSDGGTCLTMEKLRK